MVKLEILIMRKIIIVFLLISTSVNAQLDSNPFVSSTKKITENSLTNVVWYTVKDYISQSQTKYEFKKDLIIDYDVFGSGLVPLSANKYDNKFFFEDGKTKISYKYNEYSDGSGKTRTKNYNPSYWRLYYNNVTGFNYLRMIQEQDYITDLDLTNYDIVNNLGNKIIILRGNKTGHLLSRGSESEDNTKSIKNLVDIYNKRVDFSYRIVWKKSQIYTEYDEKVFEKIVDFENVDLNTEIEKYVKQKISLWQEKGEYEKTSDYNIRVTQKSRQKKVLEYEKESMIKIGNYFIESLQLNSVDLHLGLGSFEVSKYDADNETFVIKIKYLNNYIPFIVNIPIEIAQNFKENLSEAVLTDAEFVVTDNKALLSYANVNFKDEIYNYNNKNNYTYVDTKINYNFDEIIVNSNTPSSNSLNLSTNTISKGKSLVDIDIPVNIKNKNRFALIIGNEDYKSMQMTLSYEQNVDYAANDASIFKEYALKTLGIPDDNLHFMINATAAQMSQKIELVSKIVSKYENAELIVYYAGHGFPDEKTKTPYLIPVDVTTSNLDNAIKLDDFYSTLSSTNASKITVFLDACFTGGGRNKSLVSSRGIKVVAKQGSLNGNLVVFSASSGDQSSLPFHKEKHGMFTYHLLKKLQNSKGKVTLDELASYLKKEVSIQSLIVNEQDQDPVINYSQEVKNYWTNWSF